MNDVSLSSLKGKKVVLLFYPMDFSPVCTDEACEFGPKKSELAGDDGVMLGVSCDSPFTHAAFKKAHNIEFDLLADPTREMAKAYDMWAGLEPFNCTKRGTVVIDPDGNIAHWSEVELGTKREFSDLVAAAN